MNKKITALILLLAGVFLALSTGAKAAILQNTSLSLSNPIESATSVDHTFIFWHPGTSFGSATFRYCVQPSGATCTAGGSGVSGSLDYIEGPAGDDTSNWTFSWVSDAMRISRSSANTDADGEWLLTFTSMDNPARATCNQDAASSTGTCYVRIQTYSGTVYSSAQDEGTVSLTVTQPVLVSARVDPTFSITVAGVAGTGQTVNGTILTNALTTTVTSVPFGNLTANTAKFASHTITVTANNSGGYTVQAELPNNHLLGTAYGDDIDPFTGNSAAYVSTSGVWTSPTGSVSGDSTGWIGAGTDDTGVAGRGANQFFSLGTSGVTTVAASNGPANARVSRVVYGIEANPYQQSDNYTGTMTITATPTY